MTTLFKANLVSTARSMQLLPSGEFRTADGRPASIAHWRLNAEIADRVIAASAAAVNDLVIDYEHQTLRTETNGRPAPAAGWFKRLEYRAALGLFATDVRWTEAAARMIQAGEYRYISPVFSYDETGAVLRIISAALTNTPGLDGMDAVALRISQGFNQPAPVMTASEIEVCRLLGMSEATFANGRNRSNAESAPDLVGLTASQREVCATLRLAPSDFLRTLREESK